MRNRVGAWVAALSVVWLASTVFVADVVPLRAQNARWGANYFPDVTLTTHEGKRVRFYDDLIKGKIVAVNLIYTTCKYACPLETARLAQVQKLVGDRMGKDVFFYSISIDPEHDTPEVLKAYAEKFKAGPGWVFLTGKKADIDLIGKKLGIYSDPNINEDGHTPHLLVGNEATGQWMRQSGTDNPRFLATTITSWLNSWQTATKPVKSYAEAPALKFADGEYEFKKNCAACHTIGKGDSLGPDLRGVTTRRDRKWLMRMITDPHRLIEEKDPVALALQAQYKQVRMPFLGLAESDAALMIEYLAKESAAVPAAAAPAPAHAPAASAPAPRPPAATPKASTPMARMVEPYVEIQRALSGDSLTEIAARARDVAAEAAKLGASGDGIREAAAKLADESRSLATARDAFDRLGGELMRFASRGHNSFGADVHIAYCPMKDKYWLQKGQTIQNPYYGKSMLECGRLVSAVPAAYK
jgi:protein SCO1